MSPEGKEKIQLQIQLHDGSASTFHFANVSGEEAQRADRDAVKELLQQLLPKFKNQVTVAKMLVRDVCILEIIQYNYHSEVFVSIKLIF